MCFSSVTLGIMLLIDNSPGIIKDLKYLKVVYRLPRKVATHLYNTATFTTSREPEPISNIIPITSIFLAP